MTILKTSAKILAILVLLTPVTYLNTLPVFPQAEATVSPTSVSVTLRGGESSDITKTVTTGDIPPNPDIYFLTDTTGSMGATIASVRSSMSGILSTVATAEPSAHFAVGEYKDFNCDPFAFQTDQVMTSNQVDIQNAVNALTAGGGCDLPEADLYALDQVATDSSIGFRTGSSHIVVWFGDAEGHDPSGGITEAAATSALIANGMTVIAIDTGALDALGQATRITTATGGSYQATIPSNAGSLVLGAIKALTTDIIPSASCPAGISATFNPPSFTGVPGNTAKMFNETISVAPGTSPGTYTCSVEFKDSKGASFGTQTTTITVPNDPPVAVDDSATVQEDSSVSANVLANDSDPNGDPISIVSATNGASGTTAVVSGQVVYTAGPTLFAGNTDTFQYTIQDSRGANATAKVTITATAIPNTTGKVTAGGGQLSQQNVNFGFNVQSTDGTTFKGQLEYQDKNMNINLHSLTMTGLAVSTDGTHSVFKGTAQVNGVNGYTFKVTADDHGEPGTSDFFRIVIKDSTNSVIYQSEGLLAKGNIQIHT